MADMNEKIFESPLRFFNNLSIKDPYIIMLRDKYTYLKFRFKEISKIILKLSICISISTIIRVVIMHDYLNLFIIPLYIWWVLSTFRYTMASIPLNIIDDSLKSSKFRYDGINDEEMFKLLNIVWSGEGKLELFERFMHIPAFVIYIYDFACVVLYFQPIIAMHIFST